MVLNRNGVNRSNLLIIQDKKPATLKSTCLNSPGAATTDHNTITSKLKIIHLNIRSLRNTAHLIQLRELAISQKLDIITISETWLNSTVTNAEVSIIGYTLFRQDRPRKRGGGVCAFIREDISHHSERYFSCIFMPLSTTLAEIAKQET